MVEEIMSRSVPAIWNAESEHQHDDAVIPVECFKEVEHRDDDVAADEFGEYPEAERKHLFKSLVHGPEVAEFGGTEIESHIDGAILFGIVVHADGAVHVAKVLAGGVFLVG